MVSSKYRVRLARPVFQVVIVDVEAEDQQDAVMKALSHARQIPDDEWSGAFDPESYYYDAQYVQEIEEGEADDERTVGIYSNSIDRYTKYLLLKADTFSAEGHVLYQPWVSGISGTLAADLAMDWTAGLEKVRDGSAVNLFESAEKKAEEPKRGPAKVIPLTRPVPEDEY